MRSEGRGARRERQEGGGPRTEDSGRPVTSQGDPLHSHVCVLVLVKSGTQHFSFNEAVISDTSYSSKDSVSCIRVDKFYSSVDDHERECTFRENF